MPAVYYSYSSTTNGTGDGSSWTNAYNTIAGNSGALYNAVNGAAPYIVYADSASTEPLASATTLTGGATQAATAQIISVNRNGSTPPVAADITTGAKITTGSGISLTLAGFADIVGVSISVGTGNTTSTSITFSNGGWNIGIGSQLILNNTYTSSGSVIAFGGTGSPSRVLMKDSNSNRVGKVLFKQAVQTVQLVNGPFYLRNILALDSTSTIPTNFFTYNYRTALLDAEGVDFTGLTSSSNLITITSALGWPLRADFRDCLIPSAATFVNATAISNGYVPPASRFTAVRCSAVGAKFSNTVVAYEGTQDDDTTVTLPNGAGVESTLRSWHLKTTSYASYLAPFESQPIIVYNQITATPLTASFEVIWTGTTAPTSSDIWVEVEELDSNSTSHGLLTSSGPASLIAANSPVANGTSTATWNNTPTSTSQVRITTPSFTPGQIGYLKFVVKMAKASSECRIDPKPILAGSSSIPTISRSFNAPSGALMNETGTITAGSTQIIPMIRRSR